MTTGRINQVATRTRTEPHEPAPQLHAAPDPALAEPSTAAPATLTSTTRHAATRIALSRHTFVTKSQAAAPSALAHGTTPTLAARAQSPLGDQHPRTLARAAGSSDPLEPSSHPRPHAHRSPSGSFSAWPHAPPGAHTLPPDPLSPARRRAQALAPAHPQTDSHRLPGTTTAQRTDTTHQATHTQPARNPKRLPPLSGKRPPRTATARSVPTRSDSLACTHTARAAPRATAQPS